ncbi:CHY zinc finger protein [Streptococcus hongkongensis]|nr:hypothetical protein NC01_06545 [Streptococcus uberis]
MTIYGLQLDNAGRCQHYHTELDIVALKCQVCQKYYACYKCHDNLEDHLFHANPSSEKFPVVCGNCRTYLSAEIYAKGFCPSCLSQFNPNCQLHKSIYFQKETS